MTDLTVKAPVMGVPKSNPRHSARPEVRVSTDLPTTRANRRKANTSAPHRRRSREHRTPVVHPVTKPSHPVAETRAARRNLTQASVPIRHRYLCNRSHRTHLSGISVDHLSGAATRTRRQTHPAHPTFASRSSRTARQGRTERRLTPIWVAASSIACFLFITVGGTFALWSAGVQFSSAVITAGNLNLFNNPTNTSYWDVSADRIDATDPIADVPDSPLGQRIYNLTNFQMVPGDEVAVVFEVDVTLTGDNLVAGMGLVGTEGVTGNKSLGWTFSVYDSTGQQLIDRAPAGGAYDNLLYLAAPEILPGIGDADDVHVHAMTQPNEDYTVIVFGTFDEISGDGGENSSNKSDGTRKDALTTADLGALRIKLTQVRNAGQLFRAGDYS